MMEDIFRRLLKSQQMYIVIDTKFTKLHIERLMGSVRDRGRWKWIAETNLDAYDAMAAKEEEARRSHVDNNDLFPRLFFNDECLIQEVFSWLKVRDLTVTDITTPKI